jgi:hypothetical protein
MRLMATIGILAASATYGAAQVGFPYSTSFEEFAPGNVGGQQGWSTSSSATYQVINTATSGGFARTGVQSVRWSGTSGTWAWAEFSPLAQGTVNTSVYLYMAEGIETRRFGLQAWGVNLGYNPAITVRPDGQIFAQTASTTQAFTGFTVSNPLNRWMEIALNVDTVSGSVTGVVDGIVINMLGLTGAGVREIRDVDLYATGSGAATAYFDDYSAVPEPGTMLALAAGAGFLAARRRRKAS